jgi:peptide/nickel transport system permease protein
MRRAFSLMWKDRLGAVGLCVFGFFVVVAILAPWLAPHDPLEMHNRPDGSFARMDPPSRQHWFGTTRLGRDVFSQVVVGTRLAVIVGTLSGVMTTLIGVNIGLIAGYFGGRVDNILMRVTDLVYGIPFLPFQVILVALLGPSVWNIIIAIVLISWRTTARVIRSQVLTLKSRVFIQAAKVSGASDWRIIYQHIAPNVLPLALVYTALAMGWAILTEASISFLGYGDPRLISWGKILFDAYVAQAITIAWWWVVPPGLAITLLVMSGFFIGRAYEEVENPRLRER